MYATIVMLFVTMSALPQQARAQTKEAYVVRSVDSTTLTFYYDAQKSGREGTTYGIDATQTDEKGNVLPAWVGTVKNLDKSTVTAVFDASFADYPDKHPPLVRLLHDAGVRQGHGKSQHGRRDRHEPDVLRLLCAGLARPVALQHGQRNRHVRDVQGLQCAARSRRLELQHNQRNRHVRNVRVLPCAGLA